MSWTAKRTNQRAGAIFSATVAILLAVDLGAYYSFKLPHVTDASEPDALGTSYELRPDYRGAALYVREHLDARDEVMATDWLTIYFYTGKVDYLLRGPPLGRQEWMQRAAAGRKYDLYLASEWIDSGHALRALLRRPCSSSLWIVTSNEALNADAKRITDWDNVSASLQEYHRFSGARSSTDVYYVPAPDCEGEASPVAEPLP